MDKRHEIDTIQRRRSHEQPEHNGIVMPNDGQANPFTDFGVESFYKGDSETKGERDFYYWNYWANGYGLNVLLSVLLTYMVHDNHKGQLAYRWLNRTYEKVGFKDQGTRDTLSKAFTIMLGGHITSAFVKVAEDYKLDLVRWFDDGHYGEHAEQIPEIQAAHARIAEEPSPTWLGIIASRLIGWGAVQGLAATIGSKSLENPNMLRGYAQRRNIPYLRDFSVDGAAEKMGGEISKHTPDAIRSTVNKMLSPMASENVDQIYSRLMTYASTDVFYTFVTAILLKPSLDALAHVPGMRHYPNAGRVEKPQIFMPNKELQIPTHEPLVASLSQPVQFAMPARQEDARTAHRSTADKPQAETKPASTTEKPQRQIRQASDKGTIRPQPGLMAELAN